MHPFSAQTLQTILEMPVRLQHVFGLEEEKNRVHSMERTHKHYAHSADAGIKPVTLKMWGKHANHTPRAYIQHTWLDAYNFLLLVVMLLFAFWLQLLGNWNPKYCPARSWKLFYNWTKLVTYYLLYSNAVVIFLLVNYENSIKFSTLN